ncbi:MAG: NAD(P)H-binding protein [Spirochaetales bacterium]|jgi:nucleoside-diphosphate-sugar epimerase
MKILIIGGNGLLGTHAVREAIKHDHIVTILSRGNNHIPKELESSVTNSIGNVYDMHDDAVKELMIGQDAVVYSLGIDDRELHKRPAYDSFHYDHVTVCMKIVKIAKECGVKKFVVYGSYFTYFDKEYPELKLAEKNVYIRTRSEQKEAVLAESTDVFKTYVFELPYIIGYLPGKVPPWTFIFSLLEKGKKNVFFFKRGGTAVVTANQVAQATIGALEQGMGGKSYPIVGSNYAWRDFAKVYFDASKEQKKVIGIPKFIFTIYGVIDSILLLFRNKERGLSIRNYAALQYKDAFIDPSISMKALKYSNDDYENEMKRLILEWILIRRNKT